METTFTSGPIHMTSKGIYPTIGYVGCLYQLVRISMVLSPLQGKAWRSLKQYIKEEQARTSTPNSSYTTNTNPDTWSAAHPTNNTGHGYSFSFFFWSNYSGSVPNS